MLSNRRQTRISGISLHSRTRAAQNRWDTQRPQTGGQTSSRAAQYMAYSLVGRSAPMAADDSDDDDQWQDGGEDDVRERTAWQDKHSVNACFGCGKTFGALTNRHHHCHPSRDRR